MTFQVVTTKTVVKLALFLAQALLTRDQTSATFLPVWKNKRLVDMEKNLAAAAKAAEMEMEAAAVEAAAAAERAAKVVELLFQMAFLATG